MKITKALVCTSMVLTMLAAVYARDDINLNNIAMDDKDAPAASEDNSNKLMVNGELDLQLSTTSKYDTVKVVSDYDDLKSMPDSGFEQNLPDSPSPGITFVTVLHPAAPKPLNDTFAYTWDALGAASLSGIFIQSDDTLFITPFLHLSLGGKVGTSWNYDDKSGLILGTYKLSDRNYEKKTPFAAYGYQFSLSAGVAFPISENDTIEASYTPQYVGFTGADNGTPWVCGPIGSVYVNGFRFESAVQYTHYINGKLMKTTGVTFNASGFYSKDSFDKEYAAYNPGYVTFEIIPSLMLETKKKNNIIFYAEIKRERTYEAAHYKNNEAVLQTYDGSRWSLSTIGLLFRWNLF